MFHHVEFLLCGVVEVDDIFVLGETKDSELQKQTDLTLVIQQIKIPLLSLKVVRSGSACTPPQDVFQSVQVFCTHNLNVLKIVAQVKIG